MRDITLAIHEDHKSIQRLLQKLTWEMDPLKWNELVESLAQQIYLHLEAEEDAVYARLALSKSHAFIAKHSKEEHDEIRKCLQHLLRSAPESTAAIENFAGLRYLFIEHVSEEEQALYTLLLGEFKEEALDEMFQDYCEVKARIQNEWSQTTRPNRRFAGG